MTINAILAGAGAFASRKPIAAIVKLPTSDGSVDATLYFLDLPASEVSDLLQKSDNDFIAGTLCNEDGSLALEMDGDHGVKALKLPTRRAIVRAAINALGLNKEAQDEAKKD